MAYVVYGVWEENPDDGTTSLVQLFRDRTMAVRRLKEAPTYNATGMFAERATWFIEEHGVD